jgi:hypothetical protein
MRPFRNEIKIAFPLLAFVFCPPVSASPAGKDSSFLAIAVGARPAALGGAYDPLSTDVYASLWNPGGLGFVVSPEFSATHLSHLESIAYDNLGLVYPLSGAGALGASFQYLYPGRWVGLDASGNPTRDVSGYYTVTSLSYGLAMKRCFSLGVSGKMVRTKIDELSSDYFTGTVGTLVKMGRRLSLSAVAADKASSPEAGKAGGAIFSSYRWGAAYQAGRTLDLSVLVVSKRSAPLRLNSGVQWKPAEKLVFMGGYQTEYMESLSGLTSITLGMGIRWPTLFLDYAWIPMGDLGQTHQFSLGFRFSRSSTYTRETERVWP